MKIQTIFKLMIKKTKFLLFILIINTQLVYSDESPNQLEKNLNEFGKEIDKNVKTSIPLIEKDLKKVGKGIDQTAKKIGGEIKKIINPPEEKK